MEISSQNKLTATLKNTKWKFHSRDNIHGQGSGNHKETKEENHKFSSFNEQKLKEKNG